MNKSELIAYFLPVSRARRYYPLIRAIGAKQMKNCGLCENRVPEGRVVAKCDGCLALFYYGNALDEIVDLLKNSTERSENADRYQALDIARAAIKAVQRIGEKKDN
jgi:hypothetical protein